MSQVTDWFAMNVKPTVEGVYEVCYRIGGRAFWALWKAGKWRIVAMSIEKAAAQVKRSWSCYSGEIAAWRGLSS